MNIIFINFNSKIKEKSPRKEKFLPPIEKPKLPRPCDDTEKSNSPKNTANKDFEEYDEFIIAQKNQGHIKSDSGLEVPVLCFPEKEIFYSHSEMYDSGAAAYISNNHSRHCSRIQQSHEVKIYSLYIV